VDTDIVEFSAYIFDLDGTLAYTMPAHFLAWRAVTQKYGLEFTEDRFYAWGGRPSDRIFEMLSQEQGVPVDVAVAAVEKEEAFLEYLSEVTRIGPVVEVVEKFHGQVPMAVATGAMRWVMDQILDQIGMTSYFPVKITSEDTTRHKPFPDVFLEAARQLNVSPDTCCLYEHADLGIEAAKAAGMQVVDVRQFHTPRRITSVS